MPWGCCHSGDGLAFEWAAIPYCMTERPLGHFLSALQHPRVVAMPWGYCHNGDDCKLEWAAIHGLK